MKRFIRSADHICGSNRDGKLYMSFLETRTAQTTASVNESQRHGDSDNQRQAHLTL